MRDWLRKRLNSYEDRFEQSDEEFAATLNNHIDALAFRPLLWRHLIIVSSLNAFVWLSVILFPTDVMQAWLAVESLNSKIAFGVIAILFGLGMWLTYSLFRLKFPDLEDPKFIDNVLASFNYSIHSIIRWRIWLISAIGGVLNVLLLIFLEAFLAAELLRVN